MSPIDRSQWLNRKSINMASTRGFNPLVEIPKLLYEAYPNLRDLEFGFFIREDIPARRIDGWDFLTPDEFPDWQEFNNAIGLRFGMVLDADNHFKVKENYVMVMGRDYRASYLHAIQQQSERAYREVTQGPAQPVGDAGTDQSFEERKLIPRSLAEAQGEIKVPKKRGRPPKEK
jgi:hypothetical protein